MKKLPLLLGFALLVPLASAGPAAGQTTTTGARGQVLMTVHTHSAGTLLFGIDRLPFTPQTGDTFAYSSRLCSGNAPFNDLGLNFIPDYPGVDDDNGTAAVRHGISGVVTSAFGTRGSIEGTLRTVLCVPGASPNGQVESGHVIVSHFRASYNRISDDALVISGGFQISPTESTGTFRDMVGGGRIDGRFTCLGAPTCAQLGEYTDFVGHRGDPNLGPGVIEPGIVGSYYDPTITI